MKKIFTLISMVAITWLWLPLFLCAQTPPDDLNGDALKAWLKTNYYDGKHHQLGYDNAREKMYNYIDNENNTITGVYSGYQINFTYGGTGTSTGNINCEHTVPQSFFDKDEPMKSDIHHLFPTYSNWNSTRSNHPFAEIKDSETDKWMYLDDSRTAIPTQNIDLYSEYANSTFEPREDHKGNCARAIFYFYTMYPTEAGNISRVADPDVLYQWHLNDPVDAAERERNDGVETYQGNRNPFIDHPEWVARAWGFTNPEETVPLEPSLQLSVTTGRMQISWTDLVNETGYMLYKSTDGSQFSQLVTLAANVTIYEDADVTEGNTYYYYAIAFNDNGNSEQSNTVNKELLGSGGDGNGEVTDLFISEYVEGSSNNKALEIANFTGSTVNLSSYSLKKDPNGKGVWGSELKLSGSLAQGTVYVIANSNAGQELQSKADFLTSSGSLQFNGNDAVALFKGDKLIDVLGELGSAAVFAQDVTLVRKESVQAPSTAFVPNDWDMKVQDDFSNLKMHSIGVSTGTDEMEKGAATLKMYPNPAIDFVTVQINNGRMLGHVQIDLINVNGQVIYSNGYNAGRSLEVEIPLKNVVKGIYILTIQTHHKMASKKLLVK